MKVLVIGGDGVLGTALREVTNENGLDATFTSRRIDSNDTRMTFLDLKQDPESIDIHDYSIIIYVAQSRRYKEFPEGLDDLIRINLIAPDVIAKKAAKKGIKFVYCSTGSVYASSNDPLVETSPVKDQGKWDTYALSKFFAEVSILNANPHSLILRPFFIFGPSTNNTSLIPNLLHNLLTQSEIYLAGENGFEFNPIQSRDAARAVLNLVENNESGIFNLAGTERISLKKLIDMLATSFGLSPNYKHTPEGPSIIADISKLQRTGFLFSGTLESNLNKYFSEMKLS